MKYVVSCDWLSLSCESLSNFALPELDSVIVHGAEMFVCRPATECNPYYSFSRCFYYHGEQAFHFFASPRHPDANPRDCSVKVANRLLYATNWVDCLNMFLAAMGLKVNHLQRVDICADFNEFSGGRKPAVFIRDYFTAPRVSRPSFIRRGSNKFRTFGQKALGRLDFETLSFGTRDCPVQVNLYNKSKELGNKDKPYIRDLWEARGLDVDNVWRVEFSLNPQGMMLHHLTADYITEVVYDAVGVYTRLSSLFTTFAERYFKFYYVTKEDVKKRTKVKNLQPVVLFDYELEAEFVPLSLCRKCNTGERERRAAKLVCNIVDSDNLTPEQQQSFRQVSSYLSQKYNVLHQSSRTFEDGLLRQFVEGVASLPVVYSEKAQRERVNRWLQALRHKRYSKKYDDFCKAVDYIDKNAVMFMESLQPIVDTADPDLLNL